LSNQSCVRLLTADQVENLTEIRQQLKANKRSEQLVATAAIDADATRERCKTLVGFIREAWCHIRALANVAYVHGWHVDMIALHLEAITSGKLLRMEKQNRLLCNVPPGTMKSLLVSVFWPAWEWTQDPSLQYIATSYREEFCNRDTSRMRDLVCSEWYRMLWGKDREVNGKIVPGVEIVARGDSRRDCPDAC
jgi:hypothetical protein